MDFLRSAVLPAAVLAAWAIRPLPAAAGPTPFQQACRDAAGKRVAAGEWAFEGRDGYFFLAAELRQLGAGDFWGEAAAAASQASKPDYADPLPAILDFHAQLREAGIRLLLVPVPLKAAACAAHLPADLAAVAPDGIRDPAQAAFFGILREAGVEVLDLSGKLDDACYCKTDSHWTPKAGEIAARAIREALGIAAGNGDFPAAETELTLTGDLARMAAGDGAPAASETLPMRHVGGATESRDSPLLLLGDSHCLVYHVGGDLFATGGGLADQLAHELGMAVDVLGTRGSGATPARQNLFMRAKADPAYLDGKKWIVWCFASREFTQSPQGWRKLPVRPAKK